MKVKELTEFLSARDPETEVWVSIIGLSADYHNLKDALFVKGKVILWGDDDVTLWRQHYENR